MDEKEREVIDSEVQIFLQTCADNIKKVQELCNSPETETESMSLITSMVERIYCFFSLAD